MGQDIYEKYRIGGVEVGVAEAQGRRGSQEDAFYIAAQPVRNAAEVRQTVAEQFQRVAQETQAHGSGSTATVAYMGADNILTVANLGDSPAHIFIQDSATGQVQRFLLTTDHGPDTPGEQSRVAAAGGLVANFGGKMRVVHGEGQGALAVSRAFGDDGFTGVSSEPDIQQFDLSAYFARGDRVFVSVTCDGLYEAGVRARDYAAMLPEKGVAIDPKAQAQRMVSHAYERGSKDNLSVLFAEIPAQRQEDFMMAVFDGHGGAATSQAAARSFDRHLTQGVAVTNEGAKIQPMLDESLIETHRFTPAELATIRSAQTVLNPNATAIIPPYQVPPSTAQATPEQLSRLRGTMIEVPDHLKPSLEAFGRTRQSPFEPATGGYATIRPGTEESRAATEALRGDGAEQPAVPSGAASPYQTPPPTGSGRRGRF